MRQKLLREIEETEWRILLSEAGAEEFSTPAPAPFAAAQEQTRMAWEQRKINLTNRLAFLKDKLDACDGE